MNLIRFRKKNPRIEWVQDGAHDTIGIRPSAIICLQHESAWIMLHDAHLLHMGVPGKLTPSELEGARDLCMVKPAVIFRGRQSFSPPNLRRCRTTEN